MLNFNFIHSRLIKIVFAIVVSLVITNTVTPDIFFANTPRISPFFIAKIQNLPNAISSSPAVIMATLDTLNPFKPKLPPVPIETIPFDQAVQQMPVVTPPADTLFQPIRTGVYAGESTTTKERFIKYDAGVKVSLCTIKLLDGKTIEIMLPQCPK